MKLIILIFGIFLVLVGLYFILLREKAAVRDVAVNFAECVAAGNPVMESYPRQCRSADGNMFLEDIGNELAKRDLIRANSPRPNQIIASPVVIEGEARGYWYFEASFPARLLDADGTEIAVIPIQARGEWMTRDFVPFRALMEFERPASRSGTLILQKDNPSGLLEHDDELRIPVLFAP